MTFVDTTDARLSDARVPLAHKASHATGGTDLLLYSDIGAVSTSDSRLSNARTPTAHKTSHSVGGTDALTPANIGAEVAAKKGVANGYASLDSTGHVPTAQISPLSAGVQSINSLTGNVSITPAVIGAIPVGGLSAYTTTTNLNTLLAGKLSTGASSVTNSRVPLAHAASHHTGGTDPLTASSIGACDTTDARLSNVRTPSPHAASHHTGGSDVLTAVSIGGVATTDSRLSDTRTPKTHASAHSTGSTDPITVTNIGGVASTDTRLSNARTPVAHGNTHAALAADPITPASINAASVTQLNLYQLLTGKGSANGYASLDGSGKIPTAQIPANSGGVFTVNGATGPDVVLAASDVGAISIGLVGVASGIATLGSDGKVPTGQLPTIGAVTSVAGRVGVITLAVGDVTNAVATSDSRLSNARTPTAHASTHATGSTDPITPASIGAATTGSLTGLEAQTNKGTANGYASLNSSAIVPTNQLPATMTPALHAASHAAGGADVITPAAIGAATVESLSVYQLISNLGVANGYASLDSGTKVPVAQLPNNQVIVLSAAAAVPISTPTGTVILRTAT